jgi:hypothetical protein
VGASPTLNASARHRGDGEAGEPGAGDDVGGHEHDAAEEPPRVVRRGSASTTAANGVIVPTAHHGCSRADGLPSSACTASPSPEDPQLPSLRDRSREVLAVRFADPPIGDAGPLGEPLRPTPAEGSLRSFAAPRR